MPLKSLVQLCTQVCVQHVGMIYDLGDLPFSRARPILLRVGNANQLREIEVNSPRLAPEMPEIWKHLIAKDFPDWEKKNYVPKNPASWYKVYARYKREHDRELAEAEARIKDAFATLESEKEAKQSKIVEQRFLPRPPRDGRNLGGARRGAGGADLPNHLSFSGGSRTKLTNGQSFLKKARREAREVANRRALSTPTGQLPVRPGQITAAPRGMVDEHRINQQPPLRIHAPRSHARPTAVDPEQRQREARLNKIKNSTGPRTAQVVSDSEEDSDSLQEEDDPDDLFGDGEETDRDRKAATATKKPAPPRSSATASPALKKSSAAPTAVPSSSSTKKNPGLLSNAYRSNSRKRVASSPPPTSPPQATSACSPPLSKARQSSPPSRPPASRQAGSGLLSSAHRPGPDRRTVTNATNSPLPKAAVEPARPVPAATSLSPPPRPQQAPSTAMGNSILIQRKKRPAAPDIFMPKKAPKR